MEAIPTPSPPVVRKLAAALLCRGLDDGEFYHARRPGSLKSVTLLAEIGSPAELCFRPEVNASSRNRPYNQESIGNIPPAGFLRAYDD